MPFRGMIYYTIVKGGWSNEDLIRLAFFWIGSGEPERAQLYADACAERATQG